MPTLVTVGVPVYNVEKYIERCARSLFSQSYDNIEFLFVDDCSFDNSISILRRIHEDYKRSNVRIFSHNKNLGLVEARNTVIANAQGKYIMWVDSDDWVEADFVQAAVEAIEANGSDVVCFGHIIHDGVGKKEVWYPSYEDTKEYTLSILKSSSPVNVWNKISKTSLYREHNIHSVPGCNVAEDFVMSSKLLAHSTNTYTLRKLLYHHNRQNPSSYSATNEEYRWESFWKSCDSLCSYFRADEELLCAMEITKAYTITADLIEYSKFPSKKYYYSSRGRISEIPRGIIRRMELPRRFVIYLSRMRCLLVPYCRLAYMIKHRRLSFNA